MRNIEYIKWDETNWARALNYIEDNKVNKFHNKHVLELGCGDNPLSIWAAHQGGKVICSDIFKPQSKILLKLKEERIEFKIIDALDIPYRNHFDFIIFKSLLGGIGRNNFLENQIFAMEQIKKSLKKGGECLFIENMQSTFLHSLYRRRFGAGRNNWYYPSLENFQTMSKNFSNVKFCSFGFLGSTNKLLKKIDTKFDKILPKSWHYIYAGIYQK